MNADTGERTGQEYCGGEDDQDMEEQGNVLYDAYSGSHTSEVSTGPAAVELWYRGMGGWEEESGLLVQPGISDGSVRLCCPEIRMRNGVTHFHWAARVDRCLQVSVRRSTDGSFEQSCSCEQDILNTGLAEGGEGVQDGCCHVAWTLQCARRAVYCCRYDGELSEDDHAHSHLFGQVEADDAWNFVLSLQSQAVRVEAPNVVRHAASRSSAVFQFSYTLAGWDSSEWAVFQVGEDTVGTYSLDATHPVGFVLVKRWGSAFAYSCLTCRGNKVLCAHTRTARATVSLDGSIPRGQSQLKEDEVNPTL